jgi:hypothetical protein
MKTFSATDKELWDVLRGRIKYLAMNINGLWYAFYNTPIVKDGYWEAPYSTGICISNLAKIYKAKDWKKSLTRRPE